MRQGAQLGVKLVSAYAKLVSADDKPVVSDSRIQQLEVFLFVVFILIIVFLSL